MYLLTKSRGLRLAAHESLAAMFALFVAETFYRFHSFTLECLAFLATWYGFSWALNAARKFGHHTDAPRQVQLLRDHEQLRRAEARSSEIGGVRRG
jgi:hypothetical protein